MKALHKFIHLSLMVAILLASSGFRVNLQNCTGVKGRTISFVTDPACCCDHASKSAQSHHDNPCNDITCVVPGVIAVQTQFRSGTEQVSQALKEPVTYPDFSDNIRPALLETTPHFTLPPPISGRLIGILHQTFII